MLSLGDKKRQLRAAKGGRGSCEERGREVFRAADSVFNAARKWSWQHTHFRLHKLHYNNAYCDVEVDGLHPHYVPPLAVQLSAQLSTLLSTLSPVPV